MRSSRRLAFTLVELLVVIAIIGVLIALIMPAVQIAREAGRRATCENNVKQLAGACISHEGTHGFLAGGGWGWGWVGDADRGSGIRQPGGWIYNILPFIDKKNLHDMGKGLGSGAKSAQHRDRIMTPLPIAICPTRRKPEGTFTYSTKSPHGSAPNFSTPSPPLVARSDYASNAGDKICEPNNIGLWPTNCGNTACGPKSMPTDAALAAEMPKITKYQPTGVDYPLCTLPLAKVEDGATCTYLLGEKYIRANYYTTGDSAGDNENLYIGFNADISRWTSVDSGKTYLPPMLDNPAVDSYNSFGSAHPAGFHMAFCDGSVRKISFSIDKEVHRGLSNRADGHPRGAEMEKAFP